MLYTGLQQDPKKKIDFVSYPVGASCTDSSHAQIIAFIIIRKSTGNVAEEL